MKRDRMLKVSITLSLLTVVTLALVGVLSHAPSKVRAAGNTYATIGNQAFTNIINDFYTNGNWKTCLSGCSVSNIDHGDDDMTYALWLRWKANNHDANVVPYLQALAGTAPSYGSPCSSGSSCGQWSDVPMWDSIALGREYEANGGATGPNAQSILNKEKAAFNVVDGAGSSVYAFGACPSIRYQRPGGDSNQLKTLETDANYIKAALLLYRYTQDSSYLTKAETTYAAVRTYFLDATLPLYSVYVFDNGSSCSQVQGRFYASVNGDMIYNGLTLAGDANDTTYANEALATAQAVANDLSDANGVYTDLQADNDVEEPLIEGMYDVATQLNQGFAASWLQAAASASASSLQQPSGVYSRMFDGPANQGTIPIYQSNGGYALAFAEAGLNPNGAPATTTAWANATSYPSSIDTATGTQLPASINFTGSGIALIGTLNEQHQESGHVRVFVDGKETTDTTGIWQNKSSSGLTIPNTVLFAWRWPSAGNHTITLYPGIYNAKEGSTFVHIQSYLVVGGAATATTVDDSVMGSGQNQFNYSGSNWTHCASGCMAGSYNNTVSLDDISGEYATITFTGTQIKFYTDARNNRGIAGVSLDGGSETNVDLYAANDAADLLVWTSPTLSRGTHTLKIRNTGTKNSQSSGTRLAIDRVDILP